MNNKAFTLIELLAIIIILGLLATIAAPNIMSAIKSSSEKADERQKKLIVEAAERWAVDNPNELAEKMTENKAIIKIEDLKEEGYLSDEINSPSTKGEMQGCVLIEKIGNKYIYEYRNDNTCPSSEENQDNEE